MTSGYADTSSGWLKSKRWGSLWDVKSRRVTVIICITISGATVVLVIPVSPSTAHTGLTIKGSLSTFIFVKASMGLMLFLTSQIIFLGTLTSYVTFIYLILLSITFSSVVAVIRISLRLDLNKVVKQENLYI